MTHKQGSSFPTGGNSSGSHAGNQRGALFRRVCANISCFRPTEELFQTTSFPSPADNHVQPQLLGRRSRRTRRESLAESSAAAQRQRWPESRRIPPRRRFLPARRPIVPAWAAIRRWFFQPVSTAAAILPARLLSPIWPAARLQSVQPGRLWRQFQPGI